MIIEMLIGIGIGCFGMKLLEGDEEQMRELVEYDEYSKKYVSKSFETFDLHEDQLILTSDRNGEKKIQNYLLFDEPEGVCFNIKNEYEVEIRMQRIDNVKSKYKYEVKEDYDELNK